MLNYYINLINFIIHYFSFLSLFGMSTSISPALARSKYVCVCLYINGAMNAARLKSNLHAEMEAEKQMCSTKKRALQIATDELAKNQETIQQHERSIEKLGRAIDWRTLVLLRMNTEMQQYRNVNILTAAAATTVANIEQLGLRRKN
jgi:hypothetical protein